MNGGVVYRDRRHAGRLLAERLKELAIESPVVVALPRGGVPVGYEVARALGAPLDIGLVRKLGAPGQPELGIGALGEGGTVVLDRGAVRALGVTRAQLEAVIARERAELERRRERYRPDFPPIDVAGRNVVLVDDGLATGVTAAVAARVLRVRGAARVVVAVLGSELLRWTAGGYTDRVARPRQSRATLLSPPSLVEVLRRGWRPVVPLLHPSHLPV